MRHGCSHTKISIDGSAYLPTILSLPPSFSLFFLLSPPFPLSRRPDQNYGLSPRLSGPPDYFPSSCLRYIGGLTFSPLPSISYILSVLFKSEDSEKADSIMDTLESETCTQFVPPAVFNLSSFQRSRKWCCKLFFLMERVWVYTVFVGSIVCPYTVCYCKSNCLTSCA